MNKKNKSTVERYLESLSSSRKKKFFEGYKDFVLSEIVFALMAENEMSVRKLAKAAGVSPTVVQAMRTGKKDFSLKSFLKVLKGLDCNLVLEHRGEFIPLSLKKS